MHHSSIWKPFVALLVITTICLAQTYPDPVPCTGLACANPKGELDYQDFTVIRRQIDGKYFRYSKSNSTGLGLSVATAPTLRGPWNYAFEILSGPLKSPVAGDRSRTNVWAPEIHFINNTYYLFYSVNTAPFSFDLCVATSPTMDDGSWTDHGSMNVPLAPQNAYVRLDGNLLVNASDPNGVANHHYMVFGSYQQGLYGFYLADDLLTIESGATVTKIIEDQPNPPPFNTGTAGHNKTEGPFQLSRGNYTYLFYSIGGCCAGGNSSTDDSIYRVEVCRTPITTGPSTGYVDRNNVSCLNGPLDRQPTIVLYSHASWNFTKGENKLIWLDFTLDLTKIPSANVYIPIDYVYGPGSVGVLNDPVEGLVMYYQYKNTSSTTTGLGFGFNSLTFDDDNWPLLV